MQMSEHKYCQRCQVCKLLLWFVGYKVWYLPSQWKPIVAVYEFLSVIPISVRQRMWSEWKKHRLVFYLSPGSGISSTTISTFELIVEEFSCIYRKTINYVRHCAMVSYYEPRLDPSDWIMLRLGSRDYPSDVPSLQGVFTPHLGSLCQALSQTRQARPWFGRLRSSYC